MPPAMAASRLEMIDAIELGLFTLALVACWVVVKRHRMRRDRALDLLFALLGVIVASGAVVLGAVHARDNHCGSPSLLPMLAIAIRLGGATEILKRPESTVWSQAIPPLLNEIHVNLVLESFLVSINGAIMTFKSDESTRSVGYLWLKAGPSLFTTYFTAFAATAVRRLLSFGVLEQEDWNLVCSVGATLPFLAMLEAYKLYFLFGKGFRRFAPYRVGALNATIAILPQMLVIVAYTFVSFAAAPTAPRQIGQETGIGSRAGECEEHVGEKDEKRDQRGT